MYTFHFHRGATVAAGVLATTAVTGLLAGAASVSTFAAPVSWRPAPPGVPVTVIAEPGRSEPVYCFMGRHNWPTAAVDPPPRCRADETTARLTRRGQ